VALHAVHGHWQIRALFGHDSIVDVGLPRTDLKPIIRSIQAKKTAQQSGFW